MKLYTVYTKQKAKQKIPNKRKIEPVVKTQGHTFDIAHLKNIKSCKILLPVGCINIRSFSSEKEQVEKYLVDSNLDFFFVYLKPGWNKHHHKGLILYQDTTLWGKTEIIKSEEVYSCTLKIRFAINKLISYLSRNDNPVCRDGVCYLVIYWPPSCDSSF